MATGDEEIEIVRVLRDDLYDAWVWAGVALVQAAERGADWIEMTGVHQSLERIAAVLGDPCVECGLTGGSHKFSCGARG